MSAAELRACSERVRELQERLPRHLICVFDGHADEDVGQKLAWLTAGGGVLEGYVVLDGSIDMTVLASFPVNLPAGRVLARLATVTRGTEGPGHLVATVSDPGGGPLRSAVFLAPPRRPADLAAALAVVPAGASPAGEQAVRRGALYSAMRVDDGRPVTARIRQEACRAFWTNETRQQLATLLRLRAGGPAAPGGFMPLGRAWTEDMFRMYSPADMLTDPAATAATASGEPGAGDPLQLVTEVVRLLRLTPGAVILRTCPAGFFFSDIST